MTNTDSLAQEQCVACRRGAPRLSDDELAALRPQFPDWSVVERDGIKRLERTFTFPDFTTALHFTNWVGALAEAQGHHPAMLTEWGRVTVTWWTHAIKGLHRNDALMAVKTDHAYAELERYRQNAALRVGSSAPEPEAAVTLREITEGNVRAICQLRVAPEQERFVAPNAISLAEAHAVPSAWFRAVYAGETPVGFVMLDDDPEHQRYYLWRYMIAAEHQGKGYGTRALQQVIDYVKTRPRATEMFLCYQPGAGGPRDFYRKFGFEETGETEGDEIVMRLPLD